MDTPQNKQDETLIALVELIVTNALLCSGISTNPKHSAESYVSIQASGSDRMLPILPSSKSRQWVNWFFRCLLPRATYPASLSHSMCSRTEWIDGICQHSAGMRSFRPAASALGHLAQLLSLDVLWS